METDETNKLTDAGTEEMESKRFRLWLGHTESRMQSHILAGVSSSSWPSLSVDAPIELDERRQTAG